VAIEKKLTPLIRHADLGMRIQEKEGILMVPDTEGPIIAARGMLEGAGLLKAYLKEKDQEKKDGGKQICPA
jgi:hypothetical protein